MPSKLELNFKLEQKHHTLVNKEKDTSTDEEMEALQQQNLEMTLKIEHLQRIVEEKTKKLTTLHNTHELERENLKVRKFFLLLKTTVEPLYSGHAS